MSLFELSQTSKHLYKCTVYIQDETDRYGEDGTPGHYFSMKEMDMEEPQVLPISSYCSFFTPLTSLLSSCLVPPNLTLPQTSVGGRPVTGRALTYYDDLWDGGFQRSWKELKRY